MRGKALIIGMGSLMVGLAVGGNADWNTPIALAPLGIMVILGGAWLLRRKEAAADNG